jgi:hypothetical protein
MDGVIRKKRSRLEKILKAGFELGKYCAFGLVISGSLGCVHHPKIISVSEDRRYVAVPYWKGETNIFEAGKFSFAIIDAKTEEVELFPGPFKGGLWLSNTKDKIAYIYPGDKDKTATNIGIISKKGLETIEDASYPSLSADGNILAYIKRDSENDTAGNLILRNLSTLEERTLDRDSLLPDISPDMAAVSYIKLGNRKAPYETNDVYLFVSDIDGKNKRQLVDLSIKEGYAIPLLPHFIDNDRILFEKRKSKDDADIYTVDKKGVLEQISSENIDEWFPVSDEKGNIYYIANIGDSISAEARKKGIVSSLIVRASKTDSSWKKEAIKISPDFNMVIAGDKLFYMVMSNERNPAIYMTDIDNLEKPMEGRVIDVNSMIKKKLNLDYLKPVE